MLTIEELQAIKERAEKAAPGPWKVDEGNYGYQSGTIVGFNGNAVFQPIAVYDMSDAFIDAHDEDVEFLINAREDVPKLVAEVERLQLENEYDRGNAAEFLGKFQCLRDHFHRIINGEADSLGDAFRIAREALEDVE